MNNSEKIRLDHKFRLQWEPSQNAHVLLFAEGMVKLNNTAAEILKLCDGTRTEAEIVKELEDRFSDGDVTEDVHEFMKEARENGWFS